MYLFISSLFIYANSTRKYKHPFDPSTQPVRTMKEEEDAEVPVHASIALSIDDEYDDAEHGGSGDGKSGETRTSATAHDPSASPLPSIPLRSTSITRVLFLPPPLCDAVRWSRRHLRMVICSASACPPQTNSPQKAARQKLGDPRRVHARVSPP
ncbi:hypothetical protein C8J57DRAFT_1299275 [Mycena rebaudengoi]|nr:hypothetical protein C8J57DRAFT_1299275 [Mycena rebaudengoi]